MRRLPLVASFVLFLLLCASLAYWGLQLFKPPLRPVAAPPRVVNAEANLDSASVLFGGRAGKAAVATNYQLRGVIMSGTPSESVAILSAEGKPAQAIAVGKEIAPDVSVKEVHKNYVLLSEGGVSKRVELPENAKEQVNLASNSPLSAQPAAAAAVRPPTTTTPSIQAPAVTAMPPASAPQGAQIPQIPPPAASAAPSATPPTTSPPGAATTPPAQSLPQSSVAPAASATVPANPATTTAPPSMVVNPGSAAAQTGATGTGASSAAPAASSVAPNANPAANPAESFNPAMRQSPGRNTAAQ